MEFTWEERQWPYDATRLEIIAFRAGMDPDELREWLRDRIGVLPTVERPESLRLPTAEEWAWIESQTPELREAITEALLAAMA